MWDCIPSLQCRQKEVLLTERYVDLAKAEPIHMKNKVCKEQFCRILSACVPELKKSLFKDLPEECALIGLVGSCTDNCNGLSLDIKKWFDETPDKPFTKRFRGHESKQYLKHFPELMAAVRPHITTDTMTQLFQTCYMSLLLIITATTICHYHHHSHHHLSLPSSQPPSVTTIITATTICYYHHHNHHHLSLSSSQPQPSVTIIITAITICHYHHHNHHHLSLSSPQPSPSVTIITTTTIICHYHHHNHHHLSLSSTQPPSSVTYITVTTICHYHHSHHHRHYHHSHHHLSLSSQPPPNFYRNFSHARSCD